MDINTMTFVAPNLACGEARGGSIPRSGAATDEQRSRGQIGRNPSGGRSFSPRLRCSLLTDPLRDMLVARASSGREIPCRERHRIYASGHLIRPCAEQFWRDEELQRCGPLVLSLQTGERALREFQRFRI